MNNNTNNENKLKKYDDVLIELINELKKQNITLNTSGGDGRVKSIQYEELITNIILKVYEKIEIFDQHKLTIEKQPKPRCWYDILITNKDKTFYCPINIKVTDFSKRSSDNISSNAGLIYSLTGLCNINCKNWKGYFKKISEYSEETNNYYFFLIFDKSNNQNIFFNSMRRLKTLTPNGNNLPFQCKWSENIEPVNRNFEDAKNFLLGKLFSSVEKRAEILKDFNESFPDFKSKV